MKIGLETFSYHLAFSAGRMDVFSFIDRAAELAVDGVQLNATRRYDFGHLGGADDEHLARVRERLLAHGMYVELETSGTEPSHVLRMLEIAERSFQREPSIIAGCLDNLPNLFDQIFLRHLLL